MKYDYQNELSNFEELVSNVTEFAISSGVKKYQNQLNRLKKLYLLYRYLAERGNANGAPKAIRILYAKMTSCLVGVFELLRTGNPGPAAMVVRSLFETAVHLQVILMEDTANRSQLFEDYAIIERDKSMSAEWVSDLQKSNHLTEFERVRKNYHPKYPNSWCWKAITSARNKKGVPDNPSIRELCTSIGHPEYYEQAYGPLSGAIHPSPRSEAWLRRSDGQMELGPHFELQVGTVAELAIALGLDSLIQVVAFLQMSDQAEFSLYAISLVGRAD